MSILKHSEAKAHKFCQDTLEMECQARLIFLKLGERLKMIRDEQLYQPYWESWVEYTMEFKDLSPSSISKLISIYELFVLKLGYKVEDLARVGGWSKLYPLTKVIKTKKDADKWLKMAEEHTRIDLGKFLIEAKTGVEMRDCKHKNTYKIEICRDCGERWEIK